MSSSYGSYEILPEQVSVAQTLARVVDMFTKKREEVLENGRGIMVALQ